MEKEENNNQDLIVYIPINITIREELIQGISMSEMPSVILIIIIGAFITIMINMITASSIVTAISLVSSVGLAILVNMKSSTMNTSLIDLLKFYINFNKTKQKYNYVNV